MKTIADTNGEQVMSASPFERSSAEARLDLAFGYRFDMFGLRWDAQAQALGLSTRSEATVPDPFSTGPAAFLATEPRGLPLLPVLSLQATW